MARKSNPEKEMAVSGATPAKARHSTPATRFRRAAPAAKTPLTSVENSETETALAVSEEKDAAFAAAEKAEPSRDQIAHLAYLYWLNRGCQEGSAEEDWLRAEQELRQISAVS